MCNAVCNVPTFGGGVRLTPISRLSAACCVDLELRPLPSTGVTRRRRYYGPIRHPGRPGLSLTGVRLRVTRPLPLGVSRVALDLRVQACRRHYPGGPLGRIARGSVYSNLPLLASGFGLPHTSARSAHTLDVSRPARRSLALRPACSLHRLSDTCVSKAPTASLPPPPLR